jgi:hypothetical protein
LAYGATINHPESFDNGKPVNPDVRRPQGPLASSLGRTSKATEQRDKVFALLPLLEDAKEEGLQADYAKSTETVFIETAAWLASHVGISFLSCAAQGGTSLKLPSWVPDWSVNFRIPWMLGLSESSGRSAQA